MKNLMLSHPMRTAGGLALLCLWAALLTATAQEPEAAWPRRTSAPPFNVALYEPQVESYDREWMTARAAVSVVVNGAEPVFGAVWFGMRLNVNAEGTLGRVNTLRLDEMRFPADDLIDQGTLDRLLGSSLVGAELPLEPLLASLARDKSEAEAAAAGGQAVPDILFSMAPVALVRIDGEPELQDIPDLDLLVVVNSNTPVFLQKGTSMWFMQVENRWLTAAAVTGPWQDVDGVPESVKKAAEANDNDADSTTAGPQIVVVTRPTEVISTDGEPRYAVIPGTGLLYVKNTDADLFLDIAGQRHYALLAGRWFATTNPLTGPWEVAPGETLPAGFSQIPESSPKYGLLAHVPGTTVAREAVQDAEVPQTQAVKRETTALAVDYEGEPEFVQAGSTTVYYAVNTPYSVLRWDSRYYLCHSGVWYYGGGAVGPWTVCVDVPGVIYTIPPVCPIYPVTYVRVYDWTPSVVYCGYTSGYLGWYVGGPALVFGLAYYDYAWWGHRSSRYYYHHGYRCGYYPAHRPHGGPRRGEWNPPSPRPHAPPGPRSILARRPGPEVHLASAGGPRSSVSRRTGVAPARPNRYDQEPSSALARRLHSSERAAPSSGSRAGAVPDRRAERAERAPTGRDAASRDLRTNQTAPERAERTRTDRTGDSPAARQPKSAAERTERTAATPAAPTRREPAVRPTRGDRSPAATPTERDDGRSAPAPATTPAAPEPQRVRESRVAPTRRTETRAAEAAPKAAPEREAPAAREREARTVPERRTETRAAETAPKAARTKAAEAVPQAAPERETPAARQREARTAPERRTETRAAETARQAAPTAAAARPAQSRERAAPSEAQGDTLGGDILDGAGSPGRPSRSR